MEWRATGRYRPLRLERLGKQRFQELSQLRRSLKLRDRVQFLEGGRERIGETPDGPRPEFLILRFKVKVMHGAGELLGSFQFALHKRLVDDHLGRDVRQLTSLPGFDLPAHRLKVPLRVFGEHRREHARDNVLKLGCSYLLATTIGRQKIEDDNVRKPLVRH
jgi:hypothetical protein